MARKNSGNALKSDSALLAYTAKKVFSLFSSGKTLQQESVIVSHEKGVEMTENFLYKEKKSSKTAKASLKETTKAFLMDMRDFMNEYLHGSLKAKLENFNYDNGKGSISIVSENMTLATFSFTLKAKK